MPPNNTLLPVPNRTVPFWLCEVDPLLQRHRTTAELPTAPVDVVIVGAGLSGNLTAYHLLKKDPSLKVVMVEADDWCSGATARNGTSCRTRPLLRRTSSPSHLSHHPLEKRRLPSMIDRGRESIAIPPACPDASSSYQGDTVSR